MSWNKYDFRRKIQDRDPHSDYLFEPSFQGINRLFILPFENNPHRASHKSCFLPIAEIKDYNVMTDGRNFFDQLLMVKEMIKQLVTYSITLIFLKKLNYKLITIYLSKQQVLDANQKAMQQIKFTANLTGNAITFIFEEVKETILNFSQKTVGVL